MTKVARRLGSEEGSVHLRHREGGLRQHLALPFHMLDIHHQLDEDDQEDDQPMCKKSFKQKPVFGAGEAAGWLCSSLGGTAQIFLHFFRSFSLNNRVLHDRFLAFSQRQKIINQLPRYIKLC